MMYSQQIVLGSVFGVAVPKLPPQNPQAPPDMIPAGEVP